MTFSLKIFDFNLYISQFSPKFAQKKIPNKAKLSFLVFTGEDGFPLVLLVYIY